MKWRQVARLVVAGIGIACAWTVYVTLRPREVQPEMTDTPPILDATVTSTSSKGKIVVVDPTSGRLIYELIYEELRTLSDGRSIFGDVQLAFDHNGVPYSVDAKEAETDGQAGPTGEQPSTVVFRGAVHMHGEDGFCVESEDATYLGDEQRITFPGEVAFTRDRLSGHGVGADLYMDRSVFWMYDQSELTIAPDGGGEAVVATGTRIGLADADHYMRVEEGARLTQRGQELSAGLMMVHFTEVTQEVRRLELDDSAIVRRTDGRNGPDMRADSIDLDFMEETSQLSHGRLEGNSVLTMREDGGTTRVGGTNIELFFGADGETLTRLETTAPVEVQLPRDGDTPARTIQSSWLLAEGAEPNGLNRALFDGGVSYREAGQTRGGPAAAPRAATATSLVLALDGGLKEVNVATFRQNVSMTDDTMTATADEGVYAVKAGTLQLRANKPVGVVPHVVDQRIDVTANEIDVNLTSEAFDARGGVRSVLAPEMKTGGNAARATGLFENGRPISGNAGSLKYDKATGVAEYVGNVTLFQSGGGGREGTVIKADEVRLDEQKQDLLANGHVNSTLFVEEAPTAEDSRGPTKTTLTSDRLVYTESVRSAVYSGTAIMVSGEGQRLTADRITLELHAERRGLKRLEATASAKGEVRATLPEGRQASGMRLTYDAETKEYVVTGEPAQFVARSATKGPDVCEVGTGSTLSFLSTARFANVKNEGGAVGRASDQKCSEVIK